MSDKYSNWIGKHSNHKPMPVKRLKLVKKPKKPKATQPEEKIYKGSLRQSWVEGHPERSDRRFIKQQLWANKLL